MVIKTPLLSVRNMDVTFGKGKNAFKAVNDVSFDVYRGETFGLVGESGSGKTTIGRAIIRINKLSAGEVVYDGKRISGQIDHETDREVIKNIQMIFQDPMASLNERAKVDYIVSEGLINVHPDISKEEREAAVSKALSDVGLLPEFASRFPHEFSGGMRQRVVIAIAMACVPEILICDEPTTALDVTIQAQILDLLKKLQAKYGLTVIYITHDLGVVANVADRIAVMYAGDIVEIGTCDEVFYDPKHPYTWALLSSLPQLGIKGEDLYSIQGTPPNLFQHIQGDAFAPRNPQALKVDFVARPPYFEVTPTHKARTWLLDPRAPKIDPPLHLKNIMNLNRGGDLSNG